MRHSKIIIFSALLIASCSSDDSKNESVDQNIQNTGTLEISNPWARPAKQGMMSAAYFTLINNTTEADTLLTASGNFADEIQIHESFKNSDGLMGMRPVESVPVSANSAAEMKPGSFHLMIIGLQKDLIAGDSLNLNLSLSSGLQLQVVLPVKAQN